MSTTNDVLAQIDHALADYSVGPDAMRCTPDPTPPVPAVPTVPMPALAVARATLVHRLVDYQGLDPETARAAVLAAERGQHTEHTALVHAEARAVVARTTHAAAQAVAAFLRAMRPALDALAANVRAAAAALANATRHTPSSHTPSSRGADRPAWQSPYGPPPKRKR
ncbi:hypothetical protein [Streptomyces antibioticus]|uniref:hypothetical protein n=1 Tax=Streptomyces antibioticus TaxID=1890 RepID=UPI0036FFAF2D